MSNTDEHDLLRSLAYQSWLDRGQPHGSPEVDWSHAQQQLQQQTASQAAFMAPASSSELQTEDKPRVAAQGDTAAATQIPTIDDAVAIPPPRRNTRRMKASVLNASEVPMEVPPSPTTPPDQPPTKALTKEKTGRSKTVTAKSRAALYPYSDDSRL